MKEQPHFDVQGADRENFLRLLREKRDGLMPLHRTQSEHLDNLRCRFLQEVQRGISSLESSEKKTQADHDKAFHLHGLIAQANAIETLQHEECVLQYCQLYQ